MPITSYRYRLPTSDATDRFGRALGSLLKPGDLVALSGDLGSGKTALSRAIGAGLGVFDPVSSPTYTLIQEYGGPTPMFHFDPYRLDNPGEICDLGLYEYLEAGGVTVIEWADRVMPLLPEDRIEAEIEIDFTTSGEGDYEADAPRTITISAGGQRSATILEALSRISASDLLKAID